MSQPKNIPEAEVVLLLANHLMQPHFDCSSASVSIDGAAAKCYEIPTFLRKAGWNQQTQRGKNGWSGEYAQNGRTLTLHSKSGEGDIVVCIGTRRLIVECKKGPRETSKNSAERKLMAECVGQATNWRGQDNDFVFIAFPQTSAFQRLGRQWQSSPRFQSTGIRIILVGFSECFLIPKDENATELLSLSPECLAGIFSGEL